jgi:prevent-host-death family protein
MESSVDSFEAKTHLPALLERVARGERITITKRGKPVAKLVPFEPAKMTDVKRLDSEMLAYRDNQKRTLDGQKRTLDGITIRELVEERRR